MRGSNKHEPDEKDVNIYINYLFPKGLPKDALVLLSGSLGRGLTHPGSDIDLIIVSRQFHKHNYYRKIWQKFPVDLNLTHPVTAAKMLVDPDWETMVSQSKVVHEYRKQGSVLVSTAKQSLRRKSRHTKRAQIYMSEALELFKLSKSSQEAVRRICLFQSLYLGACALNEVSCMPRTGYFWHMNIIKESAIKIGSPNLFSEYKSFNSGKATLINDVWRAIKVVSKSLPAKGDIKEQFINKIRLRNLVITISELDKKKKITSSIFLMRRALLALILSLARKKLNINYDRSRTAIILLDKVWDRLTMKEQAVILKAMPNINSQKLYSWLMSVQKVI